MPHRSCPACGDDILTKRSRYCSAKCRFLSKVEKTEECWNWLGSSTTGYGTFSIGGKPKLAHRVSYELFVDEIPEGHFIIHICDNRKCINPHHLLPGTHDENMADMVSKDRQSKGARHAELVAQHWGEGRVSRFKHQHTSVLQPKQKLFSEELEAILILYKSGRYTQERLAKMFSVDDSTISVALRKVSKPPQPRRTCPRT